MNKKSGLAVSVAMITLLTSSSSGAMSYGWFEGYRPYVGADTQVRRMDFKGGFGDNLLKHHSPQGNLYAGIKLNDSVAIEAGYEATKTRTRDVTLTTGDIAAGVPIGAGPTGSPAIFKSRMKIQGPHVDLVGFYSFREGLPVQLIGSVGVSFFKGTVERRGIAMGVPPTAGRVRTLSQRKAVLRLMGGLEYKWDCNLGARATIGLVKTGKLVIFSNDQIAGSFKPAIKPKESTVYGLGMFWIF
ncbi:MAG TPA: hypothetical protein PLV31_05875 [Gammaproteobacteria bacterium]|nr:hypothetical protein [Gammaproteobacteria bacterium]